MDIAGATGSSYTLAAAQYTNAGSYSVLATNIAGSILSSNALLAILAPSPAQFQFLVQMPDRSLQLLLAGDPGATYSVESSTNMANWTTLTNMTLTGGASVFSIPGLTNDPQRYFRARSGP